MNDNSMTGYKTHDCHVLLQRLIPAGVRGNLNEDVATTLIELGTFFRHLCCKTLEDDKLRKLETNIIIILCKLERIYLPAYFDICVHLAIHLPQEAMLTGSVSYSWMYPIERGETKFNRKERNPDGEVQTHEFSVFSQNVKPLGRFEYKYADPKDLQSAHCYVLHNCEEGMFERIEWRNPTKYQIGRYIFNMV